MDNGEKEEEERLKNLILYRVGLTDKELDGAMPFIIVATIIFIGLALIFGK